MPEKSNLDLERASRPCSGTSIACDIAGRTFTDQCALTHSCHATSVIKSASALSTFTSTQVSGLGVHLSVHLLEAIFESTEVIVVSKEGVASFVSACRLRVDLLYCVVPVLFLC